MKKPRPRAVLAVTLLAGAAVAAGGIAVASIPDQSGVIHGCYNKTDGTLRVIDTASHHCRSTEIAIQWNRTGPPGAPGAAGRTGSAGPAGPPGIVWRGSWDPTTNYQKGDAVLFGGSSYIASGTPNAATAPPDDATNWSILAARGETGQPGGPGVSGYQMVQNQFTAPPNSNVTHATEFCPSGTVLLGGGATLTDDHALGETGVPPDVISSGPVSSVEWDVYVFNPDTFSRTYAAWAMCAQVA
jgi:hypothetical protein